VLSSGVLSFGVLPSGMLSTMMLPSGVLGVVRELTGLQIPASSSGDGGAGLDLK
jgi:hypothetical protein